MGDLDAKAVRDLLGELAQDWKGPALPPLAQETPAAPQGVKVYLDRPGAPQSEVRVGYPSVTSTTPTSIRCP